MDSNTRIVVELLATKQTNKDDSHRSKQTVDLDFSYYWIGSIILMLFCLIERERETLILISMIDLLVCCVVVVLSLV